MGKRYVKYICRISYDDDYYSLMLEKWEDAHILMDSICEEHDITYKDIYHNSEGRGLEFYPVTEGIQSNLGMWDEVYDDIPSPDDVNIYFFNWEAFFDVIGMEPYLQGRNILKKKERIGKICSKREGKKTS